MASSVLLCGADRWPWPGGSEVGLNWLEFSVVTDGETAEAVAQLFNTYGQGGAVIEVAVDCFEHELPTVAPPTTIVVKTYLPQDPEAVEARRRLEEGLWHLGQISPIPEPTVRELAEEEWAEGWKQHYHRLRVGRRTVIVPAWEEYSPAEGDVVIRLEPGMAFGTGLHPSTRLCLSALETHVLPGETVLDVGTGSGILAIAAAKLGASFVLALDNDPVAVRVAQENLLRNGVADRCIVQRGSLPQAAEPQPGFPVWSSGLWDDSTSTYVDQGEFHLVVVNILAPVIVSMAQALAARLASSGTLIAAGIIEDQGAAVEAALHAHGLRVIDRAQEQDWLCLVATKG